jgi:hypothetical protein
VDSGPDEAAEVTVKFSRGAVVEAVILGGKVTAKSVGPRVVVLAVLDGFKLVKFDA